jgi:hypothetical protein
LQRLSNSKFDRADARETKNEYNRGLEQYKTVAGKIFSKDNKKKTDDGTFKEKTLEVEMKNVIAARSGGNKDLLMFEEASADKLARV